MTISEFATLSNLDLAIAEAQGKVRVTRLPARKARKSELIMSMTKGLRTNTNRQGQTTPQAQIV